MRTRVLIILVSAVLATSAAVWAQNDTPPQTKGAVPPETAKEPAPPPSVTVIGAREAHGILGRDVRSAANENMGRVVDVIVDRAGVVRAAVIDFGGFLGVGSRKIVVDWAALHFPADGRSDRLTVDLTRDQVKSAPEYKDVVRSK